MPVLNLADAIYAGSAKARRAYLGMERVWGAAPTTLDTWEAAIARRENAPARILWIGDSQLEGTGATLKAARAIDRVMSMLDAAYPTTGVTWGEYLPQHWGMPKTGGGSTGATPTPWGGNWDDTRSGTVTQYDVGGNGRGPGLRSASIASGASITYTVTGSSIEVWTGAGGTLAVSIDGGAATNINTGGSNVYGNVTPISMGSNGTHTVKLTASGSSVPFYGMTVYRGSAAKGFVSIDANHYGYAIPDMYDASGADTTLNSTFRRMVALANPHLVMLNLYANDVFGSETVAQYTANLTALVNEIKAAAPGASIALFPSYAQDYPGKPMPNGGSWTDYANALHSVATAKGCYSFDITPPMPSTNLDGGAANTATGDYWDDRQHMKDLGHAHYADWVVSRIAPALKSFIRITVTPSATAKVDTPYTSTITAENRGDATGTITYSVDALPAGLSLNTSTGAVTGTPTTEGPITSTYTASNGTQSASVTVDYVVGAAETGAAAPTIVQDATAQTVSTSVPAVFAVPPTEGNLLVLICGSGIATAPPGWTLFARTPPGYLTRMSVYLKISDGSESSVQVSGDTHYQLTVLEVNGAPLDSGNFSVRFDSLPSSQSSYSFGPLTPKTDSNLALAFVCQYNVGASSYSTSSGWTVGNAKAIPNDYSSLAYMWRLADTGDVSGTLNSSYGDRGSQMLLLISPT